MTMTNATLNAFAPLDAHVPLTAPPHTAACSLSLRL
jgi:hypothetical protein